MKQAIMGCALALALAGSGCSNNAEPDNTAVNDRDRPGTSAKTADNASQSGSDIDIAASVRRALVGDDKLSLNAENVKVIVSDGRVLLRGPVPSVAERQRVQEVAAGIVGSDRVDNQIEIAP